MQARTEKHSSVIAMQCCYFLHGPQTTTVAFLISYIHHFCAGTKKKKNRRYNELGRDARAVILEAINADGKGKHSAKCQRWWLRYRGITSRRETQITRINNLIISYSNHGGEVWILLQFHIPGVLMYSNQQSGAGRCIENTVIQRSSGWTTTVSLDLCSIRDLKSVYPFLNVMPYV